MANFQWMIKILTASWSQLVVMTGVSGPHTSRKDSYLVRMLAIQVKVVVQFSALTTTLSAHSDKYGAFIYLTMLSEWLPYPSQVFLLRTCRPWWTCIKVLTSLL